MKNAIKFALVAVVAPVAHQSIAQSESEPLDIRGRIMIDHTVFDGIHNENQLGSGWALRRARIGIKHKSNKDWAAELELSVDHEDESVEIADGLIQYRGWNFGRLSVGHMKESFSLEDNTSSMDISTMERSMVTEAFAPGRNYGIALSNGTSTHSWNLGMYQASETEVDAEGDEDGRDGYALTGRLTFSPINDAARTLHLGMSASVRDMQGTLHELNNRLEIDASEADKVLESRAIAADRISQYGLEAAMVMGRFSFQTEWMAQQVTEAITEEQTGLDADFSGYYLLASYFLTGESRVYDEGAFGETKPAGKKGAVELVVRYSHLDTMIEAEGVEANSLVVGLNYYATGRAKLMLNVIRGENESADPTETGTGNAVAFRAQYEF